MYETFQKMLKTFDKFQHSILMKNKPEKIKMESYLFRWLKIRYLKSIENTAHIVKDFH